jgi:hypothetical protein
MIGKTNHENSSRNTDRQQALFVLDSAAVGVAKGGRLIRASRFSFQAWVNWGC